MTQTVEFNGRGIRHLLGASLEELQTHIPGVLATYDVTRHGFLDQRIRCARVQMVTGNSVGAPVTEQQFAMFLLPHEKTNTRLLGIRAHVSDLAAPPGLFDAAVLVDRLFIDVQTGLADVEDHYVDTFGAPGNDAGTLPLGLSGQARGRPAPGVALGASGATAGNQTLRLGDSGATAAVPAPGDLNVVLPGGLVFEGNQQPSLAVSMITVGWQIDIGVGEQKMLAVVLLYQGAGFGILPDA